MKYIVAYDFGATGNKNIKNACLLHNHAIVPHDKYLREAFAEDANASTSPV